MSASDGLFIGKGVRLHYERLCLAVRQTAPDQNHTPVQLEALAELQACRAQIAAPFDPRNEKPPSQEDRARLTSSSGITILSNPDVTSPESNPIPIRLGSDLVSVAIALSDELNINEVDAAILLYDARARAAHRPDHDVVAAAKEMFIARRRDSLLYLQEIIRAGLNHTEEFSRTDVFMSSLLKERDLLLTDYAVLKNIVDRINDAFRVIDNPQTPVFRRLLASEESLLLAETLFLLTYTVQLTSTEGGYLFPVLNQIQGIYQRFESRHNTGSHNSLNSPTFPSAKLPPIDQGPRRNTVDLVRLQSVRNLIFLSWTAALDRSRYHNVYNPRTGSVGVNELLRDPAFVRSTNHVDALKEGERDPIAAAGPALAAAELIGSLFRLAVAVPDEDEAVTMFLRASAFGDALAFLTDEIIDWVQNGAGSLSPDTDLYADVVEDLALDIAEAPRLVAALVQYAQNETHELAASDALESLRSIGTGRGLEKSSFNTLSASPNSNGQAGDRSSAGPGIHDVSGTRPPTHPKTRRNSRVMLHSSPGSSRPGAFRAKIENNLQGTHLGRDRSDVDEARSASGASLVSAVATFVSKSVSAAPAKLQCDSVGGGMRYWVGIGQSNIGFIPRIGDAVIDMWDTAMKNANASVDVGVAFQLTLQGFLLLLKTTSERRGSPAHAAASLKYLRHGGHPVASLERAAGAITFITDSLTVPNPATTLDDAEAKALCGILDVISTAADALEAHGGVMPILEDAGRDLASRLSSFIVLNIPLQLRESAINCLKSLNYSRTVPVLLETFSSDKCALLRHWARTEEAPSKTFSVSTSVMGLVTRTLDGTETCSEKTLESISVCYIIGEVLSFCNRRAYAAEAQRWEVLAAASEILVKLLTKNPSSSLSQQIATTFLQPAPGTGSASHAFQALCRTAGLLNREEHPSADSRTSLRLQTEFTGALCGRALLTQVVCLGLGDTFRWMRKAVLHSSRLLSLLLMVSPGRLSKAGIVTVSAVDLMTSEPESLVSASSLVYVPDGFDPILSRAGYSVHLSATVLKMLSMAAQRSGVFASILTKDVPQTGGSASLFRASLSRILLDAPSIIGQLSAESISFEGEESLLPFDESVLHSVLRLVEACLGPEGCAFPGMFLLGFTADPFEHRKAIEHGILGALIELVAGTNSYHQFDDPCRATAATFLEKLVSHTAKNTSSAVLDHIRSISAAGPSVRGGGFADEMLMRVLEDTSNQEEDLTVDFNWPSFSTFLSACMKLSTLHVRLFPEHEKHISQMTTSATSSSHGAENVSYKPEIFSILPSPGSLLDLIARAAIPADPSSAIDALGAWSNLLGMRLSVHSEGTGYAHDALLLDIVMKLLSALSSDSCEAGLDALVSANHGEIASASIFECVTKLSKRFESKGEKSLEVFTEDQMLAIIDGVCRGLVVLSRGGSRSEKARTNLYGTLLSCCRPTGTDLSNNLLSRGLCKRSSDVGAVGVDGLIDVTCSDALFGTTNASKSTAIALISRMVACEPSRTLYALSAQNRLRRLVTVSFSSLTDSSLQELSDSRGKKATRDGSCAAVVQAVLSLIHSISVTASGGRLLSDAGCIEALTKLLTMFEGDVSWNYNRRTTGGHLSTFGHEFPVTSMDLADSKPLVPDVAKNWQKSLLTSVTGVLATAVRCGGENVIEDVVLAIDKGFSLFLTTLRNLDLPDEADLKPICNLGMTLSRIPAHVVSVAVTCSQLRSNLARVLGRIIPPLTKTQRLGESGSFLSAGINLKHPDSAKAARRRRIAHPEGGSLYERDTVCARATTLRSIFSSFTEATALPFLFTPILTTSRSDQDVQFPGEHSSTPGKLGEVLRIAQAMLREYNRSTNESMHLDRRASGDGRPSIRGTSEIEYGLFCEEQYGIPRNALDQGLFRICLKKESLSVSRHAAVCLRVLEMALIILREYIVNASDIVQGKPVAVSDGRANLADKYTGERGEMSIEIASSFLASANTTIIPFCKDVENVQDGADSATAGAFSRQVCRQIRAACPAS